MRIDRGALDRRCHAARGLDGEAAGSFPADAGASDPLDLGALSQPAGFRRRLARRPRRVAGTGSQRDAAGSPVRGLSRRTTSPASAGGSGSSRFPGATSASASFGTSGSVRAPRAVQPRRAVRRVHDELSRGTGAARGSDPRRGRPARVEGAAVPRDAGRRRRVGRRRRRRRASSTRSTAPVSTGRALTVTKTVDLIGRVAARRRDGPRDGRGAGAAQP